MDSAAVLGIAERVAEGKLSMTGAAEFAGNLARDGCVKASVKQLATSRERDFFKWVILPLPIYRATVITECLGSREDFDALWRACGCDELVSSHVPIIIHEDATRSEICRILAWDFRQLESGLYDYVNHCGMFHAVGSAREKQAGDYLPMKAAFAFWKGDMEAHAYAHNLVQTQRYYRCNQCCDFCLATCDKRAPELNWGSLSLRAVWRSALTMSDPNDTSPWCQVPRFKKDKRLLDLLHIVHLGTLRDLIPSVIIDSLQDGTLPHFYGLAGRPWDEVLHSFSHHASCWAKLEGMQLYIGTLSMARLGRPKYTHWPMATLDTRIKAAKARTLFAFTTFIMTRLADSSVLRTAEGIQRARMRAISCWSLDLALSLWSKNGKVLTARDIVDETTWLCHLHSASYQWLACQCLAERKLLFKVRPKTHYFCHMVDHFSATQLCLMHLSTFSDEDFMHKIRCICQSCHGGNYMRSWSRRYALKRALQWRDIKKELARARVKKFHHVNWKFTTCVSAIWVIYVKHGAGICVDLARFVYAGLTRDRGCECQACSALVYFQRLGPLGFLETLCYENGLKVRKRFSRKCFQKNSTLL
ncbi:unnamed protein product [Durusdinium trenchii]|uniref:Uncharacterized protein n=1 Tax=Durusdinium trenchii TaxID=1381693 RepID=A0ABP0J2L3_9DINO